MGVEIERKFLVTEKFKHLAESSTHIVQGYLCSDEKRTVRIRVRDEKAYITIKGRSSGNGLSRFEWEKEIPKADAEEMLRLCESGIIDKHRYLVPYEGHVFEVDEFHGANDGLVMAEVELASETEEVALPSFLGKEVTGDIRYYNSSLRLHPYSLWK